jgi:hypothetical protein
MERTLFTYLKGVAFLVALILLLSLSKKHRQRNQILRVPSSHDVDFI